VQHPFGRTFSLVALSFALALPVSAQRAAGPNAGVLGTTDDPNARQTLSFRGSLFGAWDDISSETVNALPAADNRFLRNGLAGGAEGGLRHARRTGRTRWLSSADTALRVYGSGDDAIAATFAGRSDLNADLSSRVTLSLAGGLSYSPYYELAPSYGAQSRSVGSFGGGFGVATAAERNVATDGTAGIDVRLSRRDTLQASANVSHREFLDQSESTVTSTGARARYRHALTSALGVYAGFGREEARYEFADDSDLTSDTIDVGIDYGDTLEFSRRTALAFSFSTSAIRWNDDTHYRVNGSVALSRAFGRTGSGVLQYERATEAAAGFREPLLTDTFSGGFSDQIGRDTSWSVNGAYVRGEVGFGSTSQRFNVYDAGGRVTRALTRHLGIFGNYTYYRYEVPAGATVFTFLPKFSRQSASVGLTLWAPLVNDARPPREP
jgi:hypothetical protein